VYLDDQPVGLADDPRPQVAQVLAASGRSPTSVKVRQLDSHEGHDSRQLALEEYLDRAAEPTRPIYLTTEAVTVDQSPVDAPLVADAGLNGPARYAGERASGAFGQGPEVLPGEVSTEAPAASPGVSGEGNARGSLQSAYSRTGTDTAEPGMTEPRAGFGSGTGKGTSSGARESGKSSVPAASAPAATAVDLNGPFGREGLAGKQGMGPQELLGKGGVRRGPGTDLSGPVSEPRVVAGHADEAPAATTVEGRDADLDEGSSEAIDTAEHEE